MPTIKVLTYNIHKGFSAGKLRFILPKMREAIEGVNSDLVFLQEVQGMHKRRAKRIEQWPTNAQFEFLAEQLWPHYAYGKNAIYQAGHHGNAILSKYPFIAWENINLAGQPRASRSLLHGVLDLPKCDKPVHVICIHLGLFKAERQEQLERLCHRIAEKVPAGEPLIIAGDFNDWRKAAVAYLETDLGLQEIFNVLHGEYAKTFPALHPALAVDRIYFRGLTGSHAHCLKNNPWRQLSDHLPLYAEFDY